MSGLYFGTTASNVNMMTENQLNWLGHVQWRLMSVLVRRDNVIRVSGQTHEGSKKDMLIANLTYGMGLNELNRGK